MNDNRLNRTRPQRMVGRTAYTSIPRSLNDDRNEFAGLAREAATMQREMVKAMPWYMKAFAAVSVLFSLAIGVGVLALIFAGLKYLL